MAMTSEKCQRVLKSSFLLILVASVLIAACYVISNYVKDKNSPGEFAEREEDVEMFPVFGGNSSERYVIVATLKQPEYIKFKGEPFVVDTPSGQLQGLRGHVLEQDVVAFLGVPFAKPPIGHLRFRRPQPVEPWTGVRRAIDFEPHCLQEIVPEKIAGRTLLSEKMSEDCLYLNLWAPANQTVTSRLPVMFWIFGGGFNGGTAGLDETDGRVLASLGDVVVVTFNYRAGALGFLDYQVDSIAGNQGLYDMVAALQWVRDYVHVFGGDKDQVTVMSNSAGAISTGLFMANNDISRLFKRAILQSGSPMLPKSFFSKGQSVSKKFARLAGCNQKEQLGSQLVNCLQSKSPEELMDYQKALGGSFPFNPSPNSDLIPILVTDIMTRDDKVEFYKNTKDLLMGANADEGSIILHFQFPTVFTREDIVLNVTSLSKFRDLVEGNFSRAMQLKPTHAALLAEVFFSTGPEEDTTANLVLRLQRVLGDLAFTCPVTAFAREMSTYANKNVFLYQFDHRPTGSNWGTWMGSTHGDEYAFVFGHPVRYPERYKDADVQLSRAIISAWSSFAKTGDPQLKGLKWPNYEKDTEKFVILKADKFEVSEKLRGETCTVYDNVIE